MNGIKFHLSCSLETLVKNDMKKQTPWPEGATTAFIELSRCSVFHRASLGSPLYRGYTKIGFDAFNAYETFLALGVHMKALMELLTLPNYYVRVY